METKVMLHLSTVEQETKQGAVEIKLDDLGFDVGDIANNGGDDETTIVYVIKKERNFKR